MISNKVRKRTALKGSFMDVKGICTQLFGQGQQRFPGGKQRPGTGPGGALARRARLNV